jgi:TetR/AcrR family transcriptional regulator, regulator of cefoperazone and chloramphenicol sensitivity
MELTNPTGLLKEIMRSELTPLREKTQALVRELLGPGVSENQVQFSEMAIVSMCINPMLMRRIKHATDEDEKGPFSIEDLEAYADHVTQFSLAGIAAIRDQQ